MSSANIPARWTAGRALSVRNRLVRRAALAGTDALFVAAAASGALVLAVPQYDLRLTWGVASVVALAAVLAKLPILYLAGIYKVQWRRSDMNDMVSLLVSLTVGAAIFAGAIAAMRLAGVWIQLPWRLLVLDFMLAAIAVSGLRVTIRIGGERARPRPLAMKRDVLIAGAGDAGTQVARSLREEPLGHQKAAGFIDDDPTKQGMVINGIKVLGSRRDLPQLARRFPDAELWIAMPSIRGQVIRETIEMARAAGFKQIKVVPGLGALLTGQIKAGDVRSVQLEELLGRDPVRVDTAQIKELLGGKTVLITGAAGSIGSELCKQVARFNAASLIALDQDETGIFNLKGALSESAPMVNVEPVICDVRDAQSIDAVFREFRPDIVFHAAAYKHVPLMEDHPDQAVRTNVFGTRSVAEAAGNWGAGKFVLISTDKAVNPTSVMGATKRAAEIVAHNAHRREGADFVAVRFGNVLGSRGSVVPVFKEQIERGGPVTVTDPEMRRYFMTVEEAILLVLQAATIGEDGQVLVLDMGEPVRIVDLARQMIRLAGLEPDKDIPIVYTGTRPGEKLFEDILTAEEGTTATIHDRVFVARGDTGPNSLQNGELLDQLEQSVRSGDKVAVVKSLVGLVPTYAGPKPNGNGNHTVPVNSGRPAHLSRGESR